MSTYERPTIKGYKTTPSVCLKLCVPNVTVYTKHEWDLDVDKFCLKRGDAARAAASGGDLDIEISSTLCLSVFM